MRRFYFFLLCLYAGTLFGIDLSQWQYWCDVIIEPAAKEYVTLELTPEIYQKADRDLSDLRLIGSHGRQVPYLLFLPRDTVRQEEYTPQVINRGADEQGNAVVTLDFAEQIYKNLIKVETEGENFRRRVTVEGSNDNVRFYTLVENAYIFAVDGREEVRFSEIELGENDYRYLRVRVSPMASEDTVPAISSVRGYDREEVKIQRTSVTLKPMEHVEDEEKRISVYTFDLGFADPRIYEIHIFTEDAGFYRRVSLEGRNADKKTVPIRSEDGVERTREVDVPWQRVTGGVIYRYRSQAGYAHEKLAIRVSHTRRGYRYLRLTIRNYDDAPLIVDTVTAMMNPHRVLFESADAEGAVLYMGNSQARRPEYDLLHRVRDPMAVETSQAVHGEIFVNPLYVKTEPEGPVKPFTERYRFLLGLVLVLTAGALGAFIFKSFKGIESDQT